VVDPAAPKRRVLMLAYRFPPESSSIASRRPEALYRYLPTYGWDPRVITRQNELELENITVVKDFSIAGRRTANSFERPKETSWKSKLRTIAKQVVRRFPGSYDSYARWSSDVADEAMGAAREEGYDLIWATLSPHSLADSARLASVFAKRPYVLDLRDPPEEGLGGVEPDWFVKALSSASAVTVAAPSCITPLVLKHVKTPLLTLTGAWESEPIKPVASERFHIVHAGTWHSSYAAEPLFRAIHDFAAESAEFSKQCRLMFLGKGSTAISDAPGYAEVAHMMDALPLMPYAGAAAMVASASVLLIARSPSGYKSQAITGKIFEYAPHEIPLLSIGGEDDLHAALIRWLGGTWTSNVAAIKELLRAAFAQWQATGAAHAPRNSDAVAYLTQQRMAAETATVMHAVVDKAETLDRRWVVKASDVEIPTRAETPWPA
jgi:hypothetical protein